MKTKPELSIIIVCYNSLGHLKRCFDSIINSHDNLSKEVVVVDNGSSDGSAEFVKSSFPQFKLIENGKNMGFACANNIGIKNSRGKYLLILNPDTEIAADSLEKLVEFLKNTGDAGAVGPKLLYPDGSLQLSCRSFYTVRTILFRRILTHLNPKLERDHLMLDWDHNSVKEVDWVLAACLLTTREVMEKAGYFDEKYRLYFEDVDFCYRIKQLGYKTYYFPFSTVTHHHQRESAKGFSNKTLWHLQSMVRFFNKHGWKL
ncbi:MAG: glycosyltransferase family 2 protein [Elusimicrobiota bacterium]